MTPLSEFWRGLFRFTARLALACAALLASSSALFAQQRILGTNLQAIYPAGARAGSEIELEITAQLQLEGANQLVFSHPGITARQLLREPDRFYPEVRPVENKFIVTVSPEVPEGIYEVRAGGKYGLSTPRRFAVSKLFEALEFEDNNTPAKAQYVSTPAILNGIGELGQVDYFWFAATAGQTLVIDGYSERLDARGDLALELFDKQGKMLARSLHVQGKDPAIPFTPPATGHYLLRVHEVSYNNFPNPVPSPYRVVIQAGPWVEAIDPPLAERGKPGQFTLYGRNLGSGAKLVTLAGVQLEQLSVKIDVPAQGQLAEDVPLDPLAAGLDWFFYRHQVAGAVANSVKIALADGPLTPEHEPNDSASAAQALTIPAQVLGHFDRPNDLDRYTFTAKKEDVLWIEIESQRLGQPVDPLLVVEQVIERENEAPQYRELTTQDDLPSPLPQMLGRLSSQDAAWLMKVPADGTYRVLVRDLYNNGGAGLSPSYRLRIRPPQPGFRLLALPGTEDPSNNLQQQPGPRSCSIPSGGAEEILVVAIRNEGFTGTIEIKPEQLPPGITALPVLIGPEENAASLVLRAAPGIKLPPEPARFSGRTKIAGVEQIVPVVALEQIWNVDNQFGYPGRLTQRILLSIDDSLPAFGRLEMAEQKIWRMARGGKLELPFKLVKTRDEFNGTLQTGIVSLPENNRLRAPQINVSPGSPAGKLELDIQPDATVGQFTFFVRGEAEVDYRRNFEFAQQAEADKKRIDQVTQEINEAYQKSVQARQQSEQKLNESQQKRGQAEQLRNQATQRVQQTTANEQQAASRLTQIKEQLAAVEKQVAAAKAELDAAGDDNAKQQATARLQQQTQQQQQVQAQVEQITKQHADATSQLKEATELLAKSEAEFQTSAEQLVAAQTARTLAGEAEQASQADTQLAQRMQQEGNNRLNQANNVARQQKLRLSAHSDPFVVEIVPYPIVVKFGSQALKVEAGQAVDLLAGVTREFGFDGEVTFQLQGQPGGVRFQELDRIKQGQNEAKLAILTDKNVKAGEYPIQLILRMNFNGRGLEQRETITLTITPAPEEKK